MRTTARFGSRSIHRIAFAEAIRHTFISADCEHEAMSSGIPLRKYGISQYPPATPFIGQSSVHDKLETFLSDTQDDGPGNYFIFGDWGTGKSRIGHQIIAEAVDTDVDWWVEEDGTFVNQPILDQVSPNIFPIKLPLPDFVDDIDADTAALTAFNRGIERLITSDDRIYADLRTELDARGVVVSDLRRIMESGQPSTQQMKNYLEIFYSSSEIDRLVLIIDEVEDIDTVSEQAPGELSGEGVSRTRLRLFLQGLKRMVNPEHELYDGAFNVSLLLLSTLNIRKEMEDIGGFDRRNYSVEIEQPTVDEALVLMQRLRDQYNQIQFSDEAAKALFFAAYNNFGWFFSTLYLLLVHQEHPGREYDEIIRSAPGAFDILFNREVTQEIENHSEVSKPIREEILDIAYRLVPTHLSEVDVDVDELVGYESPSVIRPVGYLTPVEISLPGLKQRLLKDYGFSERTQNGEPLLIYQGDQISVRSLYDALTVFQAGDERLLLYHDEDDLRELAKFVSKGDLAEDTAAQLVQFFSDIQDQSPSFIGPTIQFLTRWSNRWQTQDEILQWLRDADKWSLLNEAYRDIQGRGDDELLRGFLFARFEHLRSSDATLSADSDIPIPNFKFDISRDDLASAAPGDDGVGLVCPESGRTTQKVKSALTNLKGQSDWPLVYLLFQSDSDRRNVMETVNQTFPHFSKLVLPHTVDQIAGDEKFYKRFSFLNQEYDGSIVFEEDDLNGFGRDRLRERKEKARTEDVEIFDQRREDGWFLKPLLPRNLQGEVREYIIKGVNHFADGAKELQDGSFRGNESDRIGRIWDKYREDQDELLTLVTENNELVVPRELTRIMWIIERASKPVAPSTLAGRLLYDSDYRADPVEVAGNILHVLRGIGALAEDDGGFLISDDSYLETRISKTRKKLNTQRGGDDKRLNEIKEILFEPVLAQFSVRAPQLDAYEEELNKKEAELEAYSFDLLTDPEPGAEWYEQIRFSRDVHELSNKGYDPQHEFSDADGGPHPAEQIPKDGDFEEFSRCYRIGYLYWLQNVVNTFESKVVDKLEAKQQKLSTTYVTCRGESFPTEVMSDLLKIMETDVKREEVKLGDELEEPTNGSFYKHLQVPQLGSVFDRMTWYNTAIVDEDRDDDPWTRYIETHSDMAEALDLWPDVKETKEDTEAFLEESRFEDDLLDRDLSPEGSELTESISGQWDLLEDACEDPKQKLGGLSLERLEETVHTILIWLPEIRSHCDTVKQESLDALAEEREALRYEELDRLCDRTLETHDIDLSVIDDQDRWIDREDKIEELEQEIEERGKEILRSTITGGDKLWEFYKQLTDDMVNQTHITSETYSEAQQRKLNLLAEGGIIDVTEITHYDITLE